MERSHAACPAMILSEISHVCFVGGVYYICWHPAIGQEDLIQLMAGKLSFVA